MNLLNILSKDTIVALATPPGKGALAIIRISGPDAFAISEKIFFFTKGIAHKIQNLPSQTLHFGQIKTADIILDEVVLSIFKSPKTYTGEDLIEISCHGSNFIQQKIIQLIVSFGGRIANPGEFTLRAFLNKKMDLAQAEAVNDLINSGSAVSHQVAMQQMRGGITNKIKTLRDKLINLAALLELELDFSEEDVAFANRDEMKILVAALRNVIGRLIESFELGNVIKNGIPVAIVGKPNAGKSTLLNALLQEERAIVSEIPGTTRDLIEDEMTIDGVLFRFIDTAGLRDTKDIVENMGIHKALDAMKKSAIIIYLFDGHELSKKDLLIELDLIKGNTGNSEILPLCNKIDIEDLDYLQKEYEGIPNLLFISAKTHLYVEDLRSKLVGMFDHRALQVTETVITNLRHVEEFRQTDNALYRAEQGINNHIQTELLAHEIRIALNHLGNVTGEIASKDILRNVFENFCIGK